MNVESRDKKKIYEVISKNRLFFALAGSIVAIIAFFTPMFHVVWYYEGIDLYERVSLWIFGLYEHSFIPPSAYDLEWFGVIEQERFGVALISIVSTFITSTLVLGTIIVASNTLIRKRKKSVYSSRLLLYFSIGLFVAVNSYMFALTVNAFGSTSLYWVGSRQAYKFGAILFFIGSVLILMGYTVKIKSLLKIISLFVAVNLIYYGANYLTGFSYWLSWVTPPIPQSALAYQITSFIIPAIIALIFALIIVLINYTLYRRAKNKKLANKAIMKIQKKKVS